MTTERVQDSGPSDRSDAVAEPSERRRLRILLSAFACGPGDEPEANAGWGYATAAARDHDVWVVTRKRFAPAIRAAIDADPELAAHLHVSHIDFSDRALARKGRRWAVYWRYSKWQRLLAHEAPRLHAEIGFDVAHHVTWANDWLPCGLASLTGVPLIWGPVGGASAPVPLRRLGRWLGWQGVAYEIARQVGTAVPRRIWGDRMARRSSLVIAQNADVAHRFRHAGRVVVEPNVALTRTPEPAAATRPEREAGRAIYVGRLIGLKLPRLALDAIARTATWKLDVYGAGGGRRDLERRARRLGIADRVRFMGHRPRDEVLAAYREAQVLLFPSVHDQAGWAVAEAATAGCPVVCLPFGGPPVLADRNGIVVGLDGDIVQHVADAIDEAARRGGEPLDRWSVERLPPLVSRWYADAVAAR